MATPAAVLSILVKADTKSAQASLVKANASLKRTAGRMDDTDKASRRTQKSYAKLSAAAYGLAGGVALVGLAGKKAFREYEEAQKVSKQTTAVLKSTGSAAKVTAAEIDNLAASLSRKSGIDDEVIQSGENMLLTFTKVRNEVGKNNDIFNQATTAALDMSVAMDQSLKTSVIQLGKALQDPTKGITALRRVGVSFTADQEAMIERWQEQGKLLKAQKFLLREVKTEFAGSAAAQATGSAKLQVAWDNLFESFGKVFGPTLERGMEKLATGLQKVGDILGNPKLTNAEKFGRIMDMVVAQVEKALPKVTEVGTKVAGALAAGLAKGWLNLNPLGKLLTAGVLIRLVGGRGALFAAGTAIGKMFGAGFGAGASTAIVPGGKAAGAKGATAFLGGFRGILGKLGIAGLVAALFGPEVLKKIEEAGTHADAAGAEFEFASKRMEKLQKAGNMGGLIKAARDAQYTAKQMGAAGAPLKALADRMEFVGDATKRLKERFFNMRYDVSRSVKELQNRVQYNTGVIAQVMDKNSARGKRAMGENFRSAALNVKLMMNAGVISVKEGTKLIEQYMVKALQTMGFSKKEALMVRKGQDPYTGKAIGGKQNLTGKQRGGPINIGAATGDSVPAMLERGEYVLNRNAVGKVGKGNLDRLNFQTAQRFQAGGMVRVPGDPDTTGGRDMVAPFIANQVASWIKRYKIQIGYAYDPGGGHVSPGHNETGTALDVVPGIGGSWDTLEAGLKAAVAAGKTVYYGTNGVGTPLTNHGRGNHGHVEWASAAGGVGGSAPGLELAPMLKRLMVEGPDSMLKATVQGALDVARGGANAVLGRANTLVAAPGGSFAGADTAGAGVGVGHGKATRSQMVGWATQALHATGHGATPEAIEKILTLAMKESSWIVDSINLWDSNAAAGNPSGGLMHVTIDKVGGSKANLFDPVKNMIASINYQFGRYGGLIDFSPYAKGGPVGYAGDSLGEGTVGPLRGIFGKDRNLEAAVSGGKSPQWGLGALKGLGKKKSHYVFDFGSNEYGGVGIMQALRQAKQYVGDKLLHTFTLNAGETEANNKIRGFGGASVIDWANKHGALGDGLHGDYGHRARLVADSIEKAAKTKQNKPKPHGKVKKRKQLHGLQAPGLNKLHNTVDALMHGDQAARTNALHGLLDHVQGTGLPKHLTDQIDGLTVQAEIAGDYADRLGQLTTEEGGVVFPGDIGGKTETMFLQEQLDALFALRNKLIKAHEAIQARREQMKQLADTARKHLEFYAHAVTAWSDARKVKEKELERLKKKPKQNKEQIKQVKALLDVIDQDQVKRVRTRDALKNRIIPALDGKRGSLKAYADDTITSGLVEVQGAGSPMTRMATLPALGVLGGSILTTQVNMARLGATPSTTTADTDISSERDDLLRELGRLTLQRSAVEKLHEITLRDFPEFDRLGAPFGGKFHTGGIVPGPVGAEATTVLQGGEGVFTRDQMAAMGAPSVTINVAPGMEWLKQFIQVEVGRTNRTTARNAGRGLPGQGGGRLR